MQELAGLVDPLLELCRQAGALVCRHYHAPGTTDFEFKDDKSPLTLADTESNALLQAGLAALDVKLPILSEESPAAEPVQQVVVPAVGLTMRFPAAWRVSQPESWNNTTTEGQVLRRASGRSSNPRSRGRTAEPHHGHAPISCSTRDRWARRKPGPSNSKTRLPRRASS